MAQVVPTLSLYTALILTILTTGVLSISAPANSDTPNSPGLRSKRVSLAESVKTESREFLTPHRISSSGFSFSEIIAKISDSCAHMKEIQHECQEECVGVNNLTWCIGKAEEINSVRTYKKMFADSEDSYLKQQLQKFGKADEKNSEVAEYLSLNYRAPNIRMSNVSKHYSNRDMMKNTEDDPLAEDVMSLLSVGNKPQVSMEWLKDNVDDWGCSVFKVGEITTKPLTTLIYVILKKRKLFESLNIPCKPLVEYMFEIEKRYHVENRYHNRLHAADVTQTIHFLLSAQPIKKSLSDLEVFALIFASAIHDVDHPGVNNPYLVKSRDPMAILYNDTHVNENHHLAVAFQLLYRNNDNFLTYFSNEDADDFRRLVIQLVISTDMNLHVSVTSNFLIGVEKSFKDDSYLTSEDQLDKMKGLLHFADISNPTKPLELYQEWCKRVTDEFLAQGDLERSKGMPISPLCDRAKIDIGKAQTGFINYIVRPLSDILIYQLNYGDDESRDMSDKIDYNIQENYDFYKNYTGS